MGVGGPGVFVGVGVLGVAVDVGVLGVGVAVGAAAAATAWLMNAVEFPGSVNAIGVAQAIAVKVRVYVPTSTGVDGMVLTQT